MLAILFLFGFSLHNMEEALWLPAWSEKAEKYQTAVNETEFRFALIIVTAVGYLLTFQYILFSETNSLSGFLYYSFILMMILNVIFPHLAATIALRTYAPGLLTGLLLIMPFGLAILIKNIHSPKEAGILIVSTIILSVIMILFIKVLFRIGRNILPE
ncbi:MAG: HXXEE domain-containing protein [Spirochaetales bacterium]|nr:HXXEE domain-containing protein [Spirochaetales bacterium]